MAHETVHAAQQSRTGGPFFSRDLLEAEAQLLAPELQSGRAVWPRLCAPASMVLADTPKEPTEAELEELRKIDRQELIDARTRIAELRARQRRYRAIAKAREPLRDLRKSLDKSDITGQLDVLDPEGDIRRINPLPVSVETTSDLVRMTVRFQVMFDGRTDKEAQALFPTLKASLQTGFTAAWNQTLTMGPFAGREFELVPDVTLVPDGSKRNPSYYLIQVRPKDLDTPMYQGKPIPGADIATKVPTSITDPERDSGVMSIPPSHIQKPDVLAHETAHLFGLVDRYVLKTEGKRTKTVPMRTYQKGEKRVDLLAGKERWLDEPASHSGEVIFQEDLDVVFENMGVYDVEAQRGSEPYARTDRKRPHVPTFNWRHLPPTDPLESEIQRLEIKVKSILEAPWWKGKTSP